MDRCQAHDFEQPAPIGQPPVSSATHCVNAGVPVSSPSARHWTTASAWVRRVGVGTGNVGSVTVGPPPGTVTVGGLGLWVGSPVGPDVGPVVGPVVGWSSPEGLVGEW